MTMRELDVFHCPLAGIQLIEASAGTGKTWNICALYLRLLLEERRPVEEILVVTFTKAATAELRERIRSRLAQLAMAMDDGARALADPFINRLVDCLFTSQRLSREDARQRLELALQSFDGAAIFTIHGFCQRALAETPFAASQPFRLDLVPDDSGLRHEVAVDFWRRQVSHAELEEGFAAYLVAKGLGPDWLAAQLARRLRKPQSHLRWPSFQGCASDALPDVERTYQQARTLWGQESAAITNSILGALSQLHATSYKESSVLAGAAAWENYLAAGDVLADLDDKQRLFDAGFLAGKTKKQCRTPGHAFFDLAAELLARHGAVTASFTQRRLNLLHDWLAFGPAELWRRKQARRQVSFDDMLGRLYRALDSGELPWLAQDIRRRYPCALIDEFQDTDPQQFAIFQRIYADKARASLFLVGDPKQAIYSFRAADLHTYLFARHTADRQHTLSANQRSTPGLIMALNRLFSANPAAFLLLGLAYQPVAIGDKPRALFTDLSSDLAPLHVWLLPDGEQGLLSKKEAQRLATQATAAEIARLLTEARAGRIRIGPAALKPADIAVVVRSHAQGSAMKQALTALGIGCVDLAQTSIFTTTQAEEVERVLAAISDPTHIPGLKGALGTELLGLDGNAIAALADDEVGMTATIQRFQDYRGQWLNHGFGFMWRSLLRQERTAARLLAGPAGERKLTNLLHLGELLQQAVSSQPGIEGLLRWLAQSRKQPEAMGETAQLRLESDENLVQILTVHKAKGLEFPIVFCPFLFDGRVGGQGRGLEGLEYHQGAQGVIDFSLDDSGVRAAKAQVKFEDAAEQARLIYVALTRAVYRCYLVAGCYATSAFGRPSPKESARAVLNWLAAGAGASFEQWQKGDSASSAIAASWQGLAASSGGDIGLAPLPASAGRPLPPEALAPESLAARPAGPPVHEGWRLGSFSALNRFSEQESAAPDHDALPLEASQRRAEPPTALQADDFLSFPSGPAAGECLHRVMELADFSAATTWGSAIDRALRERPPAAEPREVAGQAAMLRSLLADVLSTPLPEGLRLDGLSWGQCLRELEFCFPAAALTDGDLNRLLSRHGYEQPKLTFLPLHGYLKGFVDLVFQHQGRYYLLDWKSNHLGFGPAHYGPEALAQAMRQHGYHLQYLLYAVALHRYLRLRLTDYDYARHFGGCYYLFVRGVRPGWQNSDGSATGVYFHRPRLSCIDELDGMMR